MASSSTLAGPTMQSVASTIYSPRNHSSHYYCIPKIDNDDHRAVLYCLGSNYLHAGPWVSYFNSSNSVLLPYPEFRELYFNGLGLSYTQS
ncbi:hypothetical protein RclHR1_09150011 [Rhizophagus clarus]|uniref:Uncharacterized protein n=1 Tax=Rhizophagus clarus TaxID=94130 RepID=A0A2Z6SGX8_9GLOM|nr:hypothetical protein RclHR1_09150011 [Rhizophagus clarus]GES86390.1 hypothetical protein RCL_e27747_RclHR1_09150011 [Rhizophagus clarus]